MSSAKVSPAAHGGPSVSGYRLIAVVAGLLSLLTTVWAVEWIWPDGQPPYRWAVAVLAEALLIGMKATLLNGSANDDTLGWSGVLIDALINMGGILPRASAVVTFPPIAVVLQLATVYDELNTTIAVVQSRPITAGGLIVALIGGMLLSISPHLLWKRG